jgi:hypothetical protein
VFVVVIDVGELNVLLAEIWMRYFTAFAAGSQLKSGLAKIVALSAGELSTGDPGAAAAGPAGRNGSTAAARSRPTTTGTTLRMERTTL